MGEDPHEPDDRPADAFVWPEEAEESERWLCPGDRDWLAISADVGETLEFACRFSHASVDLDLALWEPGRDPRFDGTSIRRRSSSRWKTRRSRRRRPSRSG